VVEESPLSVASRRSIAEIAADRDRVWESKAATGAHPERIAGARKGALPDRLEAQLATQVEQAPDGPDWLHEIKYDGYRLIARIDRGKVRLFTRKGLDWTAKFPALAEAFATLPVTSAVIDGEVVALEEDGRSSFGALQDKIAKGGTETLNFYAFDLLYLDGWDLCETPLDDRKPALAQLIPPNADGMLRYSDHEIGHGPDFFRHACRFGVEGIVSKRRDRPYRPGRGGSWVKVKCANREELVVIGFTDPAGRRQGFGSLLLGYYDREGALHYAGRVGTGFDDERLASLRARLDALERSGAPAALPKGVSRKGVHWTEPALVAEIRFAGWTADNIVRQSAFLGLREDKSPEEVVRDTASKPAPAVADIRARDGSAVVEGVRLTNPDRVLYPDTGATKLDLAHYYTAIARWVLPHLVRRPLSLLRCPDGLGSPCFFQKHLGAGLPEAIKRVEIAEKSGTETSLLIEDLAGLLSLVQMSVLELHPWGSTIDKLEAPDRITFDLDPDTELPWERVAEAALEMRAVLTGLGLETFVKTTGGKGLHVVAPLTPKLGWSEVKAFTRAVAEAMAASRPERYTANQSKRARTGRIYIDYLRNARGATAVAAYSARARPGASVSTPLSWEEAEQAVRPEQFTIATVPGRLAALKSDPWAEIGELRQSIAAAARRKLGL
jgi:bifunctional non-homologous end joining protein LigD